MEDEMKTEQEIIELRKKMYKEFNESKNEEYKTYLVMIERALSWTLGEFSDPIEITKTYMAQRI